MIKIENLVKTQFNRYQKREFKIFDGQSLSIEKKNITMIMGESGSGKTTLLNIMSLLDNRYQADFKFNGHDTRKMSERERARIRRSEIGFVFQNYALIPELNVLENVMLPLKLLKEKKNVRGRAENVLYDLGIKDDLEDEDGGFLKKYPPEISGGQQQRVAIARALVHNPSIIFCDEPTGNLDNKNALKLVEYLQKYCSKSDDKTLVMVTHDENLKQFAMQLYELEKKQSEPALIIQK